MAKQLTHYVGGAHRPDTFRFYTKTKTVTSRWPSGIKEGASFVMPTGN